MYGAVDVTGNAEKDDADRWRTRVRIFGTFVWIFGLFVLTSRLPESVRVGLQDDLRRSDYADNPHKDHPRWTKPRPLYVEVTSDYNTRLQYRGYHSFANGYIVEPCRMTTFTIAEDTFTNEMTEDRTVRWLIECPETELQNLTGIRIETKFDQTGNCPVMVLLTSQHGTLETATSTFYSRYVRRELRILNKKDRKSFFDAFKTMLQTNMETGKKLYGPNYHSIMHYLEMHLLKASKRKCDNFHDGLGFPTQHLAMTNEFEMALQAVNPVLAVPYWDYTIDQAKVDSGVITSVLDSGVFAPSWFGSVNKNSHNIHEGEWAYTEFPQNSSFLVTNAWGFLRSPWNLNPSRYVTRFDTVCGIDASWEPSFRWPSCSVHYNMTFDDAWSSWNYYAWSSSYRPHGPVHIHVGGAGGSCNHWDTSLAHILKPEEINQLKVVAFLLSRNGYRKFVKDEDTDKAGFMLEPPSFCSDDTPVTECKMACFGVNAQGNISDSLIEQYIGQIMDMQDRGDSLITRNTLNLHRLTRSEKQELIRILYCESHFWAGDQLESSSPIESLFWTIHPTMDRLLQYKQLTNPFKSLAYENPTGNRTVYCRYHETSDCNGHHPGDLTFFKSLLYNKSSLKFESQHFTNEELLMALDPSGNYLMQYVYDNFEWDHCSTTYGIDFPKVPSSSQITNSTW